MTRLLLQTVLLQTVLLGLAACTNQPDASQSAKPPQFLAFEGLPPLPLGPLPGQPWARDLCTPGRPQPQELACVADTQDPQRGIAVTRARLQAVQASYPPDTPVQAIVQALVDEVLLARAATQKGKWSTDLAIVQRKAMVARLLVRTQEDALTPDKIADADIQTAFKNPQVRPHYDHAAAYFVTDVQLLCCKGDWRQCEKRDEVRSCIDKTQPQALALYKALALDPPHSAAELKARVAALGGQFSLAAVQDVEFWYEKSKPYDQQKGYDLMVKEFAVPVVEMQPGDLGQPIRTPFGWHIPRLDHVDPAVHKPWNDPEVRQDIATHILDGVREREVQHYLVGLLRKFNVQYFYDRLAQKY